MVSLVSAPSKIVDWLVQEEKVQEVLYIENNDKKDNNDKDKSN